MRIAVAQINTRPGDLDRTAQRIVELSRRAASEGAGLLVLPFTTFTGLQAPGFAKAEGFELDLAQTLGSLALDVACPCLVPISLGAGRGHAAEAVLLREGMPVPLRLLSSLGDAQSQETATDQVDGIFFELDGIRFAVAFDYDDLDAYEDAHAAADVVLYVTRRGFAVDDPSSALGAALAESRFRDDAWALDAWVVGVGSLGCYELQVFTGSSFVMSPKGTLAADAPAFEEAFMLADVGGEHVGETLEPELYDRSFHLWEALTLGLRDYVRTLCLSDVVLALDGRLDSSVLAALASDALSPTHVHAVVAEGLDDECRQLVARLAASLRLELVTDTEAWGYEGSDAHVLHDMTQVRLASEARARGALVLSSADKTNGALEVEIGRCESAALAPLGDVYRTDVTRIARLRNTISPVIPPQSLRLYDVPQVVGLDAIEHTPEMRLERIDVILATHVEWGRSLTDVVARHGHSEVCAHILEACAKRQGARALVPPCLIISSCTLREVEAPFGMAWSDRLRSDEERAAMMGLPIAMQGVSESAGKPADEGVAGLGTQEVAALLEQVQDEVARHGLEMPSSDALERQVRDLLGLIRDVLQSGSAGDATEGPFGPLTWGSPFSEN